jgi:hypothetical protein
MFDVRAFLRVGPVAQRLEQGIIIQDKVFACVFTDLRSVVDRRYFGSLDSRSVTQNCAVLQPKVVRP